MKTENKSDTKKETKYIKELVFRDTSVTGGGLLKQGFFSTEKDESVNCGNLGRGQLKRGGRERKVK